MRPLVTALLASLLCFGAVPNVAPAEADLRDFQGNPTSLEQHVGGGMWALVMLWASDCHVCNEEAAGLVAFHERRKDVDARLVGIAMDGWEGRAAAAEFIERHGITFENILGEPSAVAALYSRLTGRRWIGTPTFLLYSPEGELRAQQVGAVEVDVIEAFIARHGAGG